ncbi:MAG TPA: hypothetical protein VN380_16975 [Thermoanaerobaculia bacterium]|jgi:hypothetical protein|nr:hypothetical protein [Thermoanaerobaculia bacterium]
MSAAANDRKAVGVLASMVVIGAGLLAIPFFLTPPAYLDLALRDAVFASDLAERQATITEERTGKTVATVVEKIGGAFVARIGRINSGPVAFTAHIPGYKPRTAHVEAAALQTVRVPLDLTPEFGRLELTLANATQRDQSVMATVKEGTRAVTSEPQRSVTLDLPPGRHRLSAEAPGFCPSEREFDVQQGKVTKAALPLSPDLTGDEVARFVLGWRNEPRDLDTHFWKSDAHFPDAATVYFRNKDGLLPNGNLFAHLDVDQLYPGAYETLTVRNTAEGSYRYFVHVYQGSGTIADAGASIQVYTRGCQVRTFTPPPNCTFRIWNVATFHLSGGQVILDDVQQCQPEGPIVIRKPAP